MVLDKIDNFLLQIDEALPLHTAKVYSYGWNKSRYDKMSSGGGFPATVSFSKDKPYNRAVLFDILMNNIPDKSREQLTFLHDKKVKEDVMNRLFDYFEHHDFNIIDFRLI